MNDSEETQGDKAEWRPLSSIQRRVAGVLVEKSKTTPDVYPMTINAIRTASNQKSNRNPQMDLDNERVENTLYELREMGAVIEVMGDGRTAKYKHCLYEWLAVERDELAVMAELLLRGEQTLGDLRARSARMEKIAGINELTPIISRLLEKNLMVELSPKGRGQIVTHNLYLDDELQRLKLKFEDGVQSSTSRPLSSSKNRTPSPIATVNDDITQKLEQLTVRVSELENQLQEILTRLA